MPPRNEERRKEIIRLVCEGMTNKEIAKSIGLAVGTVNLYLMGIYAAHHFSGFTARIQLMEWASGASPKEEVVWYWKLFEGEVPQHENCQGPDCSCFAAKKG